MSAGAGHLRTLFLLERQEQRIPIYALIDRCTAARNAALDALAACAHDADARKTIARVTLARQRFVDAFQDKVDTVETDLPAARPLMVERTLPALREMLNALDGSARADRGRERQGLSSRRYRRTV